MRGYGMLCHMKARFLFHERRLFDDGAIMEMKIWRLPEPVPPTTHGLKYRLFYGYPGRRLVGYDNERQRATTSISTTESCPTASCRWSSSWPISWAMSAA
jgi:Family of unknown function (DUF6516)